MYSNKHEEKLRELRRVRTEIKKLDKEKYHGGVWEPCPPFQYGWFREYVLRDDVSRRNDAPVLQQILNVIGCRQWCKTEDFIHPRYGKLPEKPMDLPMIKSIPVHFEIVNGRDTEVGWPFPDSGKFRKWFEKHCFYPWQDCSCRSRHAKNPAYTYGFGRPHYWFSRPWMFDTRIRPAIITKLQVINPDLESARDRLGDKMRREHGWELLYGRPGDRSLPRGHKYSDVVMQELEKMLENNTYE